MTELAPPPFAQLTTMAVGGPPARMVSPATEQDLVDQTLEAWASGDDWMLLGGGSNTVVADEGFDGTVIRVLTRGVSVLDPASASASEPASASASASASTEPGRLRLRVQAGEPWDELVAYTVAQGWAGIEALSGIPGSTGAAPVQNIGAYGQELGSSLAAIDFLDYETHELRRMPAAELALGYRTSVLKQGLRGLVVAVELDLHDTRAEASVLGSALSRPVAYAQLATALGVQLGDRVPLTALRETVLGLRAAKGMVLDPADPDTRSSGSFFTNPIVSLAFSRTLPAACPRWPLNEQELPDRVIPLDEYAGVGPIPGTPVVPLVKLSAAWLIENSGITRGFRLPGSRAAVSSKHTLALTNTGGATADEIAQLARLVLGRVQAEFGVNLQPEPVLVGLDL
ncbi:UDP-N-acetylmuramate dehydrogenase [Cryobacterium sp. TmT2-59]|uniref:UDP-N-acetylmuramate dehydrogenase n=1 Tax=unclassified Cryobacterium TaxID=2649013 RepID=UPI00106B95AA|nr:MULTISPECIES: UDP-N-acetylmuramate dehydrogenase [unclassified Cryobacterium]TFC86266.1 UDP-N-acetylmuramate dehydrogenase [Cryobacterium sp. TmT2-59]TFD15416.1 UDP-N-acetylmuramate dehydrogenase [Cryobacterium sp. TMT4-10]TFD16334.1 UDP-N-acetylmuramate dehydrogenase [Cryobacterium sp. TMT2-23]